MANYLDSYKFKEALKDSLLENLSKHQILTIETSDAFNCPNRDFHNGSIKTLRNILPLIDILYKEHCVKKDKKPVRFRQ